jgi:hypothetical protein
VGRLRLNTASPEGTSSFRAFGPCRTPAGATAFAAVSRSATIAPDGLPRLPASLSGLPCSVLAANGCTCRFPFPVHATFTRIQAGRRPHLHLRRLFELHSRYGPCPRSGFCHTIRFGQLSDQIARQLPDSTDHSLDGVFFHYDTRHWVHRITLYAGFVAFAAFVASHS